MGEGYNQPISWETMAVRFVSNDKCFPGRGGAEGFQIFEISLKNGIYDDVPMW
jgi:hypothetical protein